MGFIILNCLENMDITLTKVQTITRKLAMSHIEYPSYEPQHSTSFRGGVSWCFIYLGEGGISFQGNGSPNSVGSSWVLFWGRHHFLTEAFFGFSMVFVHVQMTQMTPGGLCHRLVFFFDLSPMIPVSNRIASWDCLSAKTRNQVIPVVYSWLVPPPTSVCFLNVVFTRCNRLSNYPTDSSIFFWFQSSPKGSFTLRSYWYSTDILMTTWEYLCVFGACLYRSPCWTIWRHWRRWSQVTVVVAGLCRTFTGLLNVGQYGGSFHVSFVLCIFCCFQAFEM